MKKNKRAVQCPFVTQPWAREPMIILTLREYRNLLQKSRSHVVVADSAAAAAVVGDEDSNFYANTQTTNATSDTGADAAAAAAAAMAVKSQKTNKNNNVRNSDSVILGHNSSVNIDLMEDNAGKSLYKIRQVVMATDLWVPITYGHYFNCTFFSVLPISFARIG